MATLGPYFPASGANDASAGTLEWTTPGNITADDAAYAVATGQIEFSRYTYYLRADWASFVVPLGATSITFALDIKRKCSVASRSRDNIVQMHENGVLIGSSDADTVTFYPTVEGTASYDGVDGLWGVTKTDAEWRTLLNSGTFGIFLQCYILLTDPDPEAVVSTNCFTGTVTYTAGGVTYTRSLAGVAYQPHMNY